MGKAFKKLDPAAVEKAKEKAKEAMGMAEKRDRDFARGLARFEELWRRVDAARAPRETAEKLGVKLMPRKGCARRCAGSNSKF